MQYVSLIAGSHLKPKVSVTDVNECSWIWMSRVEKNFLRFPAYTI